MKSSSSLLLLLFIPFFSCNREGLPTADPDNKVTVENQSGVEMGYSYAWFRGVTTDAPNPTNLYSNINYFLGANGGLADIFASDQGVEEAQSNGFVLGYSNDFFEKTNGWVVFTTESIDPDFNILVIFNSNSVSVEQ